MLGYEIVEMRWPPSGSATHVEDWFVSFGMLDWETYVGTPGTVVFAGETGSAILEAPAEGEICAVG
jgi:hypothetical protein